MPSDCGYGRSAAGLTAARILPFSNREEDDGAASVIRTRDLTLTKGALYRWSYGSITVNALGLHEIARLWQARF